MADRKSKNSSRKQDASGWARLVSRMEREGEDGEYELMPGIVVRDGRIAPGANATDPTTWVELAKFVGAAGRLLWSVMRDPRVPVRAKVVAGAAAAYAISPIDVVPDFVPTAGYVDDVFVIVGSLRYLANLSGYEVLREHWSGSDEGFAILMGLVGP
ncbi:MAG TPA: DUF1232 domain-containing protein [Nitriliruptoraceae bacterium]|nr:DUF1232 domain-containing protein [Nitriliruptoraceae bacterium]